jgi:succinate dehydrogenase/fumarate reductase-like Fe-S protein
MGAIWAKINLAFTFLKHLIRRPFHKTGYRQFMENYRADRLLPLSTVDKDWLLRFSRCFNCGLCDSACPALLTVPREEFPGPSYLVTTLARSTPDFWAARLDFSLCEGCRRCEEICPNQVPVKEALEFIEAKMVKRTAP